jgi:hypothetical protein
VQATVADKGGGCPWRCPWKRRYLRREELIRRDRSHQDDADGGHQRRQPRPDRSGTSPGRSDSSLVDEIVHVDSCRGGMALRTPRSGAKRRRLARTPRPLAQRRRFSCGGSGDRRPWRGRLARSETQRGCHARRRPRTCAALLDPRGSGGSRRVLAGDDAQPRWWQAPPAPAVVTKIPFGDGTDGRDGRNSYLFDLLQIFSRVL